MDSDKMLRSLATEQEILARSKLAEVVIPNSTVDEIRAAVTTKTKILAYLGELRRDEWVLATKLCLDLGLRYTTVKNTLALLEDRGVVAHRIIPDRRPVAEVCIPADTMIKSWDPDKGKWKYEPFIPPDWEPAYGKHPHSV